MLINMCWVLASGAPTRYACKTFVHKNGYKILKTILYAQKGLTSFL